MKSVILSEDTIINGIPRSKGEFVVVPDNFSNDFIKTVFKENVDRQPKKIISIFRDREKERSKPEIIISKQEIIFENNDSQKTIFIKNSGIVDVVINSIKLTGKNSNLFILNHSNEFIITKKQKFLIGIEFLNDIDDAKNINANLKIESNAFKKHVLTIPIIKKVKSGRSKRNKASSRIDKRKVNG